MAIPPLQPEKGFIMVTILRVTAYFLLLAGLLLCFGAAGTSDVDPTYPLFPLILLSVMGVSSMFGGVLILKAVDGE
jgi:hypothetical protein